MSCDSRKLHEGFCVCDELTRTSATVSRPECTAGQRTPAGPCKNKNSTPPCRICLLSSARGQVDCLSSAEAQVSPTQPCPCLSCLWCAPSFSSLFFRFSVLVSRALSCSRRCAVATSAIRGVRRGGCPASPCSGKVPPDFERGQWHQEHRAPTREPRIFSGIPSVGTPLVRSWLLPYLLTSRRVSDLPAHVHRAAQFKPYGGCWSLSRRKLAVSTATETLPDRCAHSNVPMTSLPLVMATRGTRTS